MYAVLWGPDASTQNYEYHPMIPFNRLTLKDPGDPGYDVKIVGGKHRILWDERLTRSGPGLSRSLANPEFQTIVNSAPSITATSGIDNKWSVLPPIGNGPSLFANANTPPRQLMGTPNKNEMNVLLRSVDEKKLSSMLQDLRERDLQDRGLATPRNLNAIAMQYNLPLNTGVLESLYQSFSSPEIPGTVDYEHLMAFLLETKRTEQASRASESGSKPPTNSLTPSRGGNCEFNRMPKSLFAERDEARLILELERELMDGNPNVDLFRRRAYEADRERRGVLSKNQLETLFDIANIKLSNKVLERLLDHTDKQGYGLYSITTLLEYMERAKPQMHMLFNPSVFVARRIKTPPLPFNDITRRRPPSPPPLPPRAPETPAWESNPPLPRVDTEAPLDKEEWLRRYERMAHALYNSHQDRAGYLPAEEIRHVVDTYNLVYNLRMSPNNINQALSAGYSDDAREVDIRTFTSDLSNRHLRDNF